MVVAAKEICVTGNTKTLDNSSQFIVMNANWFFGYSYSHSRSLNHPNLLSLLGTLTRPHSTMLITNYVRGNTHSIHLFLATVVSNRYSYYIN